MVFGTGYTNLQYMRLQNQDKAVFKNQLNDLEISPVAAVRSELLEPGDACIDFSLQMNALCEISARQWLKASRQRGSISCTQLAVEGFEMGLSELMAISLIGTSQVPIF